MKREDELTACVTYWIFIAFVCICAFLYRLSFPLLFGPPGYK